MNNYSFKYRWITWVREAKEYWQRRKEKTQYNQTRKQSVSTLKRVDVRNIPTNLHEIRLFAILRNESLRLPHFIQYYKKLGIDRFFFIDNNSTDNSAKLIAKESNTHLFSTTENYANHWYWMEYMLEKYGENHWCVVVDIDELFSFPNAETLTIRDLIAFLDDENTLAIRAYLLDVYSKQSIESTQYVEGNPLNVLSYFDREYDKTHFSFLDRNNFKYFNTVIFTGGMRERVFGVSNPPHILSKIPLFKNVNGTYLVQGMHAINNSKLSDLQGVVFHTKFLSDFINEVKEEVIRGQHYGNALYYKNYAAQIDKNIAINFYHDASIKFKDATQLVALGIMKTSEQFETFCKKI